MRIAHVTATFPPYRGGTGNVCYHNARELVRRGHDVHVFTAAYGNAPANEIIDGIALHRLRPLVRFGNAALLPGLLRALQHFDLVHLHYPFFGGESAALATWLRRLPLVITYHQDVLLTGMMGAVAGLLQHTLGRWVLRSADQLLFTSSDYGQASHARQLVHGCDDQIGELPNGVDTSIFTPSDRLCALREQYQLPLDQQIVLLVAGLDRPHAFKGVVPLIHAIAQLPATHALIVGDGELRSSYETLAHKLGIHERVHFSGRVSDAELPQYYRLADVTVLPSTTMGEAFGLVLLESLACGTPVIASDLPGVRTVVAHGQDGLLVAPNDSAALAAAISQIRRDTPSWHAMSIAGRAKTIAKYDWQQIGEQLEHIYQRIVRQPEPTAHADLRGVQ
jgi:glycosyltransferase involved in cell wall biosynthesis